MFVTCVTLKPEEQSGINEDEKQETPTRAASKLLRRVLHLINSCLVLHGFFVVKTISFLLFMC